MPLTHAEEKSLIALHDSVGRREQVAFLAEGVRVLEEALHHGVLPQRLFVDAAGLDERGEQLRLVFSNKEVLVTVIPSRQLAKISTVDKPQGLIGLFPRPKVPLKKLGVNKRERILWSHALADPGNMGTMCRSALAFGVGALIVSGFGVDPYHPKVVRSSAGAIFGLRIVEESEATVLEWATKQKLMILALALTNGKSLRAVIDDLRKLGNMSSLLLAVGSESHGLPPPILDAAWQIVRIEQDESVESLNAAVAASILLYETRP